MVLRDFISGYRTMDFLMDNYDIAPTRDDISKSEEKLLNKLGYPIESIERLNINNDKSLDGIAYTFGGACKTLVELGKIVTKKGYEFVKEIKSGSGTD
ncbi:MAG: hypothetical protein ABIF40_01310 [archaeon]